MRRLLIPLALAALVVGTASTPPRVRTFARDEVVLRYRIVGAFGGSGMPIFTLYGDGRVMTLAWRVPLPRLYVSRVPRAVVSWIADEAARAGVDGADRDYGDSPGVDAGTDVFDLPGRHGQVRRAVPGLLDWYGNLSPAQTAARRRLLAFKQRLINPRAWLGPRLSPAEPYVPVVARVRAFPWLETRRPRETRVWHGPPLAEDVPGSTACRLATGSELAAALPDLTDALPDTRWRAQGTYWEVYVRPYFPDESGCLPM